MKNNIILKDISIKKALEVIDSLAGQTLFLINKNQEMVGTLSDGDIRRGIIKGVNIEGIVEEIMLKDFKYLKQHDFSPAYIQELRDLKIQLLPILSSDKKIIDIIDLRKLKSFLPLEAVLMAGGKGTRLRPLTLTKPKPLLEIGDKPIIEYNIDRLIEFGVKKIYISVNYLKQQIKDYFGDGSSKGISIEYIEETEITGTLGSATYINSYSTSDILVMNSDLLTNINYEDLYLKHKENKGQMTVATVPYEVNIPYGVVETEKDMVLSLKEKPTYTYYSNAGIYIIDKKCIEEIPQKTFYNATDLINKLLDEERNIINFPIIDYWLDIGKPKDFEKAQQDIKHLQF